MSADNINVYIPVLILMSIGVLIVFGSLLVGKIIRPHKPNRLKEQPYECGEDPEGDAWANFNIRFYVIALVFIIFDVEGALMFPVASVFKKFMEAGEGAVVLGSLLVFIVILFLGVIYCWSKGDLDWVKSFQLAYKKEAEAKSLEAKES
ncbi:MAG: NADH-quinone oxidoreductase subunit A [Bacteriovoracaceae bacterium]